MAKKNKEKIILEDIELKPQVIGYTYQKKNNIGRVIFIFVIFAFAVFYINDISVFINNLLGKNTASSINANASNNKTPNNNANKEENEVIYNIFSNNLVIEENKISLNNFNFTNNKLTFDISNNSGSNVNLSNKKYFVETYTEDKTLLERYKLNIKEINNNNKISYEIELKNNFYYLVLEEKNIEDYPVVTLKYDQNGIANITCAKNREILIYKFKNEELLEIKHTIEENDTNAINYYVRYNNFQSKSMSYNNIDGVTATFNGSLNGYTAIFVLDLQKVNLANLNELYYYSYKTIPKVVKFEMQTYGFNCN